MRIVVFGGSGFIGQHLAAALAAAGHEIVLPVRNREKVKDNLILLPNADVIAYNPTITQSIVQPLEKVDAVINLVGILNERHRGDFERIHCEFVRVLVNAAAARKVRRFVHMSALNAATTAPSAYLRSKAKAEQIVRDAPAMRCVIVRPSVVFGEGDRFVNLFVRLARLMPVMALPCAAAKMQPIAVADVVRLLARVVESGEADGKTFSAGGPEIMTLADIVRRTLAAAGIKRPFLALNPTLSYLAAAVAEAVPGINFISRDNCLSARIPSICQGGNNAQALLGALTPLDAGLAAMFAAPISAAYAELRERSHR